jgi:hypothetical protein
MLFKKKKPQKTTAEQIRLLTNCDDDAERQIIISLMDAYDIAVFIKDPFSDSGDYIQALTEEICYSQELFVLTDCFEKANTVLSDHKRENH